MARQALGSLLTLQLRFRSNSAHDLGEDIDPEMLPDLETLQESFEIPPQLRVDLQASAEASQGDLPRNAAHSQHQHHQQHSSYLGADQFHKGSSQHCVDHHSGHASGATTPSGPRSTASDESLHPSLHCAGVTLPQQVAGSLLADPAQLSPARLAQSKSMPLLDDFEGLTELQQQAADMLADVSAKATPLPVACPHTGISFRYAEAYVVVVLCATVTMHDCINRLCTGTAILAVSSSCRPWLRGNACVLRMQTTTYGTQCSMMRWLLRIQQLPWKV